MYIYRKILVFFLAVFVIIGCKKQGAEKSSPNIIQLMGGYHVWTGKKFFFNSDSGFHLYIDSIDVTISDSITVRHDSSILIRKYLNNFIYDTLRPTNIDTLNKILTFSGGMYFWGSPGYGIMDSLSYHYSDNTLYWYEKLTEGLSTSSIRVHSP